MKIYSWLPGLLALLSSHPLYAEKMLLESGEQQAVLVELYTSEGCSSCPPAERYLNRFIQHDELWRRYIPVAFHVDYWDYLGWKDRFSKQQYSQRQRDYARARKQPTVYTPAFMVNGNNWRPGFYDRDISSSSLRTGKLKLFIEDGNIQAEFHPVAENYPLTQLNIALLGMGIESEITSGENSGKHARHEFVVLFHQQINSSNNQWRLPIPVYGGKDVAAFALAAWVNVPGDPAPVQSVGGRLPGSYLQ